MQFRFIRRLLRFVAVPLGMWCLLWLLHSGLFASRWTTDGWLIGAVSPDGSSFAMPTDAMFNNSPLGSYLVGLKQLAIRRTDDGTTVQQVAIQSTQKTVFSPNTQLLAASGHDSRTRVWRVRDGTLLGTFGACAPLPCGEDTVESIALSSNLQFVATGDRGSVWVWRLSDSSLQYQWSVPGRPRAVAFSADSTMIAATVDGRFQGVQIWRLNDGQLLREIPMNVQPTSLAFSPDGQWLAVGAQSSYFYPGQVQIWRVAGQGLESNLTFSLSQWVFSVAWSPDGRYLAAGGYRSQHASGAWFLPNPAWLAPPQRITVWYMDGPFRGWRAQTTWTGHTTSTSLALRPDRWQLISSGETAVMRFRFVPLPVPPSVLVGASMLVSLGLWARSRRSRYTG